MQSSKNRSGRKSGSEGFTFIELLVVIAVLAVLTAVLAPALGASRPDSKIAQCLDGKRQLTLAWQMYASDNSDKLMYDVSWVGGTMNWTSSTQNTNTAYLTDPGEALIASYNKSASVFKCPADYYQSAANPGPRVRSVSLNAILSGNPTIEGGTYFSAQKLSDLAKPGPAMVYVFLDEHADSINDGIFFLNPGFSKISEQWRDLPASYHNGACGISFADGHAEMHAWLETSGAKKTIYPVLFQNYISSSPWGNHVMIGSRDYEYLDARMPFH